jgi:ABC-type uncharacterized transport system involved in gliding motility auxiliary subunit
MVLVLLATIPVVALVNSLHWRVDFTEERAYSLSPATVKMLEELDDRLQVKLYFNRDIEGAESLLPARLVIEDLLQEIERRGAPWVSVETVDPTTDMAAQRDAEHVGVTPMELQSQDVGGFSASLLYQGLELRYQNRSEVIPFLTPNEFEFAFTVRLAELQRAQRPVIGMVSDEPLLPPQMPGAPRQVPEGRIYEQLRVILGQRYAVRDIDPSEEGAIASDIVAIIVACPHKLSQAKLEALDRYLAEGGHVLVLQDSDYVDPATQATELRPTGLESWLASYGVVVGSEYVFDEESVQITVRQRVVNTNTGPEVVPVRAAYGFGLLASGDSLVEDHIVTSRLEQVAMFWAHPLRLSALPAGIKAETLISSSGQSWLLPGDSSLEMSEANTKALRDAAYATGPGKPYALAAALRGVFPPNFEHEGLQPAEGLMVVISNSELFHNVTLGANSSGNADFASNLLDWMAQDAGLIELRSRGKKKRPLLDFASSYIDAQGGWTQDASKNEELDRDAVSFRLSRVRLISWANVLIPVVVVFVLGMAHRSFHRRRARNPFQPGGQS